LLLRSGRIFRLLIFLVAALVSCSLWSIYWYTTIKFLSCCCWVGFLKLFIELFFLYLLKRILNVLYRSLCWIV
jgi:hypothetical protein